jgi:hypothetical protein
MAGVRQTAPDPVYEFETNLSQENLNNLRQARGKSFLSCVAVHAAGTRAAAKVPSRVEQPGPKSFAGCTPS